MLSVEEQEKINEIINLFRHSKKTSCIVLVDCVNQVLRSEIEEEIRRRLREEGFVFKKVKMAGNGNKNLPDILKRSKPRANKIFFIYDFKKSLPKDFLETKEWPESLQHLNYNREDFVDHKISALFWLDKPTLQAIAKRAPDFWAFRNLVVDFVETKEKIKELKRARTLYHIFKYSDKREAEEKMQATRKMLNDFVKKTPKDYDVIYNLCNDLGMLYYFVSDLRRSLQFFKKSLDYALKSDDKEAIGVAVGNIGLIYHGWGHLDQALVNYRETLANFKKIGNLDGEAWILNLISLLFINKGDLKMALKHANDSLKISRKIGSLKHISDALDNIAYILSEKGKLDEALSYLKESLEISRMLRYHKGVADELRLIAGVYEAKGQLEKAKSNYKRALKIDQKIGYLAGVGTDMSEFGRLYQSKGDLDKALECYLKSLKIARKTSNPLDEGDSLFGIGSIYDLKGLYKKALKYYEKSLVFFKKVGAKREIDTVKSAIRTTKKEMEKIAKS